MPASVDRNELVDALLSRLSGADALSGLQVERFPDDPREFVSRYLKSRKGAVLVSYAGMRKRGGEGHASRLAAVDLVVIASRKETALQHIGDVEALLDGKRLALTFGAGRATLSSDQFLREDNQRYQYLMKCLISID